MAKNRQDRRNRFPWRVREPRDASSAAREQESGKSQWNAPGSLERGCVAATGRVTDSDNYPLDYPLPPAPRRTMRFTFRRRREFSAFRAAEGSRRTVISYFRWSRWCEEYFLVTNEIAARRKGISSIDN